MNVLVALRFAARGLGANKLRSMLTTLGILIGVASVIVLLAVGTGSTAAVKANISKLGTNTLTVNRSATGNGRGGAGFGGARGGAAADGAATGASTGPRTQSTNLTLDDAYSLTDPTTVPDAAAVAPVVTAQSVVAAYTGVTHTVGSFVGTSPSYLSINNDTAAAGNVLSDSDFLSHAAVADLGATVAKDLFGEDGSAAVNKTLQLNGKNFLVQGVLQAKGSSGIQDQDDVIIAPLTAVQDELTGLAASLSNVTVQATGTDTVDAAQSEIENVLDSRHHVTAASRDYTVLNQASIIATATSTTSTLTVLLGAVAAISLLVGGIGVMNIILVTVTERTREIGIRKAIGAGRGDILVQFVAEAVLLSIVGGLVGVAIGLIGSRFRIVGVQPVVEAWSVFLAFGVAVAVGLFFGIYPANRAASLRPIDALRYE